MSPSSCSGGGGGSQVTSYHVRAGNNMAHPKVVDPVVDWRCLLFRRPTSPYKALDPDPSLPTRTTRCRDARAVDFLQRVYVRSGRSRRLLPAPSGRSAAARSGRLASAPKFVRSAPARRLVTYRIAVMSPSDDAVFWSSPLGGLF